jgi:hypothetical protein
MADGLEILTATAQSTLAYQQTFFTTEIDVPSAAAQCIVPVCVVEAQVDAGDARQVVRRQVTACQEVWIVAAVVDRDSEWCSLPIVVQNVLVKVEDEGGLGVEYGQGFCTHSL